jgi:hypothetical protein
MSILAMKFVIGTTFISRKNGMTYTVFRRTTDISTNESFVDIVDKQGNIFKNAKESELREKLSSGQIYDQKLLNIFSYPISREWTKEKIIVEVRLL